jgi:pre-rRNA-processing protein TSR1
MFLCRKIGGHKRKIIHNKNNRPHLYCEETVFVPDSQDSGTGTLQCTGFLRGVPLSANSLCHVPGLGDFQISKIEAPQDPYKKLSQL